MVRPPDFDDVGENAIIAWNGSRSLRGPFTMACRCWGRQRRYLCSLSIPSRIRRSCAMAWCATSLTMDSHARLRNGRGQRLSPAEVGLSHVTHVGGDLVVMGAYGHARLRDTILGGMTRDMLRCMTVPVLMAH